MNPLFLLFKPGMVAALLIAVSLAQAKSAEHYFRGASYHYVAGKIQEASVEAEEGLRVNPADARLQALAEHLRKMKDEQRGGSGQDKNPNNQQQNKEDQQNQKDRNDNDSQENKKDGENDGDKGDQKNNDRDNPGKGNKPEESRDENGDGEGDRPQPRTMSEEEAKRLLNSFADDEKKEQAERRKVIRARAGTEQDW